VADRRGKSAAEVAINWCICKGVIPICGARDSAQVSEALRGATDQEGRLTESEISELDEASDASAEYARGFELI
jgi:pyridoxine 4-dehydrogenase